MLFAVITVLGCCNMLWHYVNSRIGTSLQSTMLSLPRTVLLTALMPNMGRPASVSTSFR